MWLAGAEPGPFRQLELCFVRVKELYLYVAEPFIGADLLSARYWAYGDDMPSQQRVVERRQFNCNLL